jgi:hypothetical protein
MTQPRPNMRKVIPGSFSGASVKTEHCRVGWPFALHSHGVRDQVTVL